MPDRSYLEHFAHLQQYPGMYLVKVDYYCAVAYLDGYDAAKDGAVFVGFREWMASRYGSPTDLHWAFAALYAILPGNPNPISCIRRKSCDHAEMIKKFLDLFFLFAGQREQRGLRAIFLDYERWLRKQDWYDLKSPEWYDWNEVEK